MNKDINLTRIGISGETTENPGFLMGNFSIPPGGKIRRHFNVNADLAMYKVKGQGRLLVGPDHEAMKGARAVEIVEQLQSARDNGELPSVTSPGKWF